MIINAHKLRRMNDFPIETVADFLGLNLRKGRGYCPSGHDSRSGRSFSVSATKNVFSCFSCGVSGGPLSLWIFARDEKYLPAVLSFQKTFMDGGIEPEAWEIMIEIDMCRALMMGAELIWQFKNEYTIHQQQAEPDSSFYHEFVFMEIDEEFNNATWDLKKRMERLRKMLNEATKRERNGSLDKL